MAMSSPSTEWEVWTWYYIRNRFGANLYWLESRGRFIINGTTSTPIDAYGNYQTYTPGLHVSTESAKGPATTGAAWARTTFYCSATLGITPVEMMVESFAETGRVYMYPNASYSWGWD
jgi:hypothetical protein